MLGSFLGDWMRMRCIFFVKLVDCSIAFFVHSSTLSTLNERQNCMKGSHFLDAKWQEIIHSQVKDHYCELLKSCPRPWNEVTHSKVVYI